MSTAPMVTTYSMWSLFRNCRKAVDWRYLQQLAPLHRDHNLYFGSLIHECLQSWHQRRDLVEVLALVNKLCPNRRQDEGQRRDWHLATAMMTAYASRYATEDFEVIALEKNFEGPIINPDTGAASRSFVLAGKVDGTDASRKRQNVRIWHIGTHWAKQEFYDWLRIGLPDDGTFPPGFQHYAYKDQDFYRGLCSESRIIRSSGKVEWVPDKSVRNEPLDLAVLCRAAAAICGIDRFTDEDWAELEGIVPAGATSPPRSDGYWGARDEFWGTHGSGKGWFK